jgi:hypothetical protein
VSESRLTLKHPTGFFAAGCEMKEALTLLSDGAFKIYVYVCLHADRRTAQLRFRMAELAQATGHSTRSLTSYLEELRSTAVSLIYRAANQHEVGLGGRAKPANEGQVKTGQRRMHSGH